MSFWGSSSTILLGLHVHCLLGLFSFGIVLLGLLVEFLFGGGRCLVTLLAWLPLIVKLLVEMGMRFLVGSSLG